MPRPLGPQGEARRRRLRGRGFWRGVPRASGAELGDCRDLLRPLGVGGGAARDLVCFVFGTCNQHTIQRHSMLLLRSSGWRQTDASHWWVHWVFTVGLSSVGWDPHPQLPAVPEDLQQRNVESWASSEAAGPAEPELPAARGEKGRSRDVVR